MTATTRPGIGLRRKLLGLGGLGALVGLMRGPERAEAANGDKLIIGASNSGTATTTLNVTSGYALQVENPNGAALRVSGADVDSSSLEADTKSGGTALVAESGTNTGSGPASFGVFAKGAVNTDSIGGAGGVAVGGDSLTDTGRAGRGAVLNGGSSSSNTAGTGVRAVGGDSVSGAGGMGVSGWGGESTFGAPGNGLEAYGGDGSTREATPGIGLVAYGGEGRDLVAAAGIVAVGGTDFSMMNNTEGTGVYGEAKTDAGVRGENDFSGPGVLGTCKTVNVGSEDAIAAVHGLSTSGPGGLFESFNGPGLTCPNALVYGVSEHQPGLIGTSDSDYGIVGTSVDSAGVAGLSETSLGGYFETSAQNQYALAVSNTQAAGPAGNGSFGLTVNGDYLVENGTKSAAVQTSQGMRLLYVVESPISLFEDFGTVRLVQGRAQVELESLFAETIDTGSYQVFLSPRGDTPGVYLAGQDARGFEIREQGGGTSTVDVSYRVAAQRKGLTPSHRLASVQTPPAPKPLDDRWRRRRQAPPVPKVSIPPRPPFPKRPVDVTAPNGERR